MRPPLTPIERLRAEIATAVEEFEADAGIIVKEIKLEISSGDEVASGTEIHQVNVRVFFAANTGPVRRVIS
jgi:hypothetical protein